ncbi:hypothetical protein EDD86DRAFT_244034 [Gorgonomyces haynaldii]|nr:hypothetical protein EDD86DRAFT_244034 [Gorgonomyces haynaldii]
MLLPIEIIGIMLGFFGFFKTFSDKSVAPVFSWAFLWFGLMNVSAIFCHNLSSFKGDFYGIPWSFFAQIDCGFTGASSLNLIIGAFYLNQQPLNDRKRLAMHVLAFLAGLGVIFMEFFGYGTIPFTSEIVYGGLTIVAALALSVQFLCFEQSRRAKQWIPVIFSGAVVILVPLALDRLFCTLLGSSLVTSVHFVFLGCHVSFFGLLQLLTPPKYKQE